MPGPSRWPLSQLAQRCLPGQRTLAGGLRLTKLAKRTHAAKQALLYSVNQDARRAR